jgi:hypothetical protein
MKKFETIQDAKNSINSIIASTFKDSYNSYSSAEELKLITSTIKFLFSSKSAEDFDQNYTKLTERNYYHMSNVKLYVRDNYSYIDNFLSNISFNSETVKERAFVLVGEVPTHILDLAEFDMSHYVAIVDKLKETIPFFLAELLYEYAVSKKDYTFARIVLEHLINKRSNGSKSEIAIKSSNTEDYWPLLSSNLYTKLKTKTLNETLASYLEAVGKNDSMFSIDYEKNDIIIKKFRKHLKATNSSMYSNPLEVGDKNINPFDILESNPAAKKQLFKFDGWKQFDYFRKLKSKDEARLHDIIIDYLNNEHRNGLKKSQFLRTYRKIKDEVTLDVFRLNSKLQSYILLEEIS